jgi:hypothetical protein
MKTKSKEEEPALPSILQNESLSSETKVKQITGSDSHMIELKKCLEKSHMKNTLFRSNKVKLTFTSTNPSEDLDPFDDFCMTSKVEPDAVKELLSDFLHVERVKQINENEFEVEVKDRTQAQLVHLAFDGLELEELQLKLSVSEVKLKMKSKLRNKKIFKPYLGINSVGYVPRKSSYAQTEMLQKESSKKGTGPVIKNPMIQMVPNKYQFPIMKDPMNKFRTASFNGNLMGMGRFPEDNMEYIQMQYRMAQLNMMNSRNKNQLSKNKQNNRDLKNNINYSGPEELLAGIVLISSGKNKPNTNKFTCRYNVMIENDKNFQVAKKIIGSKGCNMKSIIDSVPQQYSGYNQKRSKQDALKLRLRGKGSGFKEGPDQRESDEPLHLCISAKCESVYLDSCKRVERLLNKIYEDYLAHLEKSTNASDSIKLQNPKKFRFQKYEGNAHMFK